MCEKLGEVMSFVEKYHLDTMLANRAVHIFNDNAIRKILQHRQKQLTLKMKMKKMKMCDF